MQKVNNRSELASYEQGVPRCSIGPRREVGCNRDVANLNIGKWTNGQNSALLSG
jgi:hypothetical protein